MKIKEIKNQKYKWINITELKKADAHKLREEYGFHPLDLEDVTSATHRSKIDIYPNYVFIVLLFPVYNRQTQEIETAEVDFFVSEKYLISIHNKKLPPLMDTFNLCQINNQVKEKLFGESTEKLLYEIVHKLYQYCYPMLDHVSIECDHIEKKIFKGFERQMVKEISITRRNITDYRKILQPHKNVLKKLTTALQDSTLFLIQKTDYYYDDLLDYTKEIWDILEGLKERIEALQETNESLITFRLNDIMKFLTIISVILLPLGVITGLFGMNTKYMPFIDGKYDFWIIVGICLLIVVVMTSFFRKRRWFS